MPCSSLYTPFQRFLVTLLLFSLLLGSCCNPNIGMGKKALPTPEDPAKKQSQYEEKAYDSEQKKLLHICPDAENTDQLGYVYVGRTPSQAKPHPQLLSSPAARQTNPPSQVGLTQHQANEPSNSQIQSKQQQAKQPQQAGTSPQQDQE